MRRDDGQLYRTSVSLHMMHFIMVIICLRVHISSCIALYLCFMWSSRCARRTWQTLCGTRGVRDVDEGAVWYW